MLPSSEWRNPTPPAFKTLSTVWLALLFQMSHVIRDDGTSGGTGILGARASLSHYALDRTSVTNNAIGIVP